MSMADVEVVDSQVHIWDADTPEHPWDRSFAIDAHGPAEMPAATVLRAMNAADVDAGVIVPVSFEGNRNDHGLAACRTWPGRYAMLGRYDVSDPDVAPTILRDMAEPGFLGLRLTFNRMAEPWLRDGTLDWLWPFLAKEGVPVAMFPKGDLGILAAIARRNPGARFIIDHLATSEPQCGYDVLDRIMDLEPLGKLENIAVKASALPVSFPKTYSPELVRTVMDLALDWFGASRVFWGSDYTRYPEGTDYGRTVRQFRQGIAHRTAAEQSAIMGGSLRSWFHWTGRDLGARPPLRLMSD